MPCVDEILAKLLAVRTQRGSKFVCMTFEEVLYLCTEAKELFLREPSLLEIQPPVNVCGDIHGQYTDLLKLLDFTGHPPVPYLFLGDYVDRGKNSLETICLLFCYKLKHPTRVHLLRGNHEAANINKLYGFFDECKRRFNVRIWRAFIDTFDCLPVAATIGGRILCMHGGLSPDLNSLDDIRAITRPTDVPDDGLLCDLLWADPDSRVGWHSNDRGVSFTFGPDIVHKFLHRLDLDLIARAHQVVEDGYQFHARRGVVTIFSAPNYCNEWDNSGAVMAVDENLVCSFHRLVPNTREKRRQNKALEKNNHLDNGNKSGNTNGSRDVKGSGGTGVSAGIIMNKEMAMNNDGCASRDSKANNTSGDFQDANSTKDTTQNQDTGRSSENMNSFKNITDVNILKNDNKENFVDKKNNCKPKNDIKDTLCNEQSASAGTNDESQSNALKNVEQNQSLHSISNSETNTGTTH